MLLRELLEAPGLRLHLLHTAPGALDKPVGRVVTQDLLEPGRYLSGGELLLTGLVWHREPGDSERFVRSVIDGGALVLLAGKAHLGEVPDDLVDACCRHDLTLAEVPVEVSFTDIAEHIAARDPSGQSRASASLVRQRELLSALADGRSLDELAARVSAEVGQECRVLTTTGRHVVPGPDELDDLTVDTLVTRFLTADRLPATVGVAGSTYTVFAVGSGLGNRLTGWLLVSPSDHTTWSRDHVEAVHELCAIAALDRSRRDEGLRALRPLAAEALALVDAGAPHADVAAQLRQAGLDLGHPVVVIVVELVDDGPLETAQALVEDVALTVGAPVVAADREGRLVAVLPAVPGIASLLRRAFARLEPGIGRARLSIGVSGEVPSDNLAGALEEARFAQRVAQAGRGPVSVVGSDEVTSHVLLLAAVPDDVRRTYAHRVLGPVLDYDERTRAQLVPTLIAFLECSGSWARTAERLHLHTNTVHYRVQRIEELTGRDLSRLEDRVDVFLALKSL